MYLRVCVCVCERESGSRACIFNVKSVYVCACVRVCVRERESHTLGVRERNTDRKRFSFLFPLFFLKSDEHRALVCAREDLTRLSHTLGFALTKLTNTEHECM